MPELFQDNEKDTEHKAKQSLDDFIQYVKSQGIDIQAIKSSDPDSFIKIFGTSFCDDAVSRRYVLDRMRQDCPKDCETCIAPEETCECKIVLNAPPVYPVPRTGQWRPIYQGDEIINYRCTECEQGNTFGKKPYNMNYCPYCGAKMIESQESEE